MSGYITELSMSVPTCCSPGYAQSLTLVQVGHDESSLTYERTLENLYINPILDVLERQNPDSPFLTGPTKKSVAPAIFLSMQFG
jgi:hypothetical protein